MANILGISAGFHDAAATVLDPHGHILFAAHSERYSKIKNDHSLHADLLAACMEYGIDTVAYYERPWLHNIQQWWSSQRNFMPWTTVGAVKKHLGEYYSDGLKTKSFPHHLSHAAAGFQTSPFDSAAVVIIDAIGELDTVSIYRAWYDVTGVARYRRVWRKGYPHSIGLFYSAVTQAVGLKPMEEEYITMGMAAYGSDLGKRWIRDAVISDMENLDFKENLHIGLQESLFKSWRKENLAASAQGLVEELIMHVMRRAKKLTGESNLVYMGGVALNCVANARLGQIFSNTWIMPNPGDAGSSLGAAALCLGKKIHWQDAYLGYDIVGPYPVKRILDHLVTDKMVGVASGRAEFGPRALGNRSLLADPRGLQIKDRVNEIKRRQKFRPFAPAILSEMADEFFEMPPGWQSSDYMQVVARCRYPDRYPAICHVDGTSRVQTVPANGTGFRQLLEQWFTLTGCPMLLNTSLNIRGEPMVNDLHDALRWEKKYNLRVLS